MEENNNVLDMNKMETQTEPNSINQTEVKKIQTDQSTMHISDNSREAAKKNHTVTLWAAVILSTIGSAFLSGYSITVVASSSKYVHEFYNATWIERYGEPIGADTTTMMWSITVAIYYIGGAIGSIIGSVLVQRLGRRNTLLVNNCVTLAAVLFMGVSERAGSFEMLAIGRFISGLSEGTSDIAIMMYLIEISPTSIRGSVCSTQDVAIVLGIVLGQVLGLPETLGQNVLAYFVIFLGQVLSLPERLGQESRWIYLYVFILLPAVLQLALLPIFPESPRYLLIQKNDEAGAKKALQMFRREEDVSEELEEIKAEGQRQRDIKTVSVKEILRHPHVRWQMIVVCVMAFSDNFCGVDALYYYSDRLFTALGFGVELIPYFTLGLGGIEVISIMIVGTLIELTGRRILLIVGYGGMAVLYVLLTATLVLQDKASWMPYLSFASVLAVVVFQDIGPGGVSSTVVSELFEYSFRSSALMIHGILFWMSNFTMGMIFPYLQNALQDYVFLVFMGICAACAIFLFFVLPETKAKTFTEISQSFSKLNKIADIDGITGVSQSRFQRANPPSEKGLM